MALRGVNFSLVQEECTVKKVCKNITVKAVTLHCKQSGKKNFWQVGYEKCYVKKIL